MTMRAALTLAVAIMLVATMVATPAFVFAKYFPWKMREGHLP